MTKLIPSKDVREYIKSINYKLTDFQKATLIWNTPYDSLDEQLNALKEIVVSTDNIELKKQLEERIAFEKDSIKKFKENTPDCIYVVYNENECDSGYFTSYDIARQYCIDKEYKYIRKHILVKTADLPLVRSSVRLNPYLFPKIKIILYLIFFSTF